MRLITLCLSLFMFFINVQAKSFNDTISGTSIHTYKNVNDVSLTIQVLKSSKEAAPTLVFFYGGGWKGGTVKQFEPPMRYFQNRDFTSIVLITGLKAGMVLNQFVPYRMLWTR